MDTPLSNLSEQEREHALEHFRIIRPFLEEGKALTQIARDHHISLRTLRRRVQQYRADGLVGLGRTQRSDQGTQRLLSKVCQPFRLLLTHYNSAYS
jgi:putative transposase